MTAPKVSICIPAYNQVAHLKRALESLQIQTFSDYEIIITDDSTNDSVKELVAQFDFGGKLKYFKNSKNLGSPANWNETVSKASGEYIKILHHDDWFNFPYSLEEYVRLLDMHPESDFAFSATSIFHSSNNTYTSNSPDYAKLERIKNDPESLFFGNFIGAPSTTIYRKSVNLQYDVHIKYVVDIDFYIRLLNRNNIFQYTEKLLICNTSEDANQVTAASINKDTILYEYAYLYNKLRKDFLPEPRFKEYFKIMFDQYDICSLSDFRKKGGVPPKPYIYFYGLLLKRRWKLFKNKLSVTLRNKKK